MLASKMIVMHLKSYVVVLSYVLVKNLTPYYLHIECTTELHQMPKTFHESVKFKTEVIFGRRHYNISLLFQMALS